MAERKKHNMHPNSLANLAKGMWKKGQVTNPTGTRKSISSVVQEFINQGYELPSRKDIEEVYRALLVLPEDAIKEKVNSKDEPMLIRIVAKAIMGGKGFDIIERIIDRAIGKAGQNIDITSGGAKIAMPMIEIIDSRELVKKEEV